MMLEFFECCFGFGLCWILVFVLFVVYVFIKVLVMVYVGVVVFKMFLLDIFGSFENVFWIGVVLIVVFIGFYIFVGGLCVVLMMDVV